MLHFNFKSARGANYRKYGNCNGSEIQIGTKEKSKESGEFMQTQKMLGKGQIDGQIATKEPRFFMHEASWKLMRLS